MKKYYFASGIRGIVGEHSGNIIGAKAKAQKLAEQLDEEITIFVRSNKEIDYSSINTGDGMWNIINDYCYYVDKVCPETIETVETEEKAEEEIITMANTNASIAKAEEQKTQFDFYNVTIGFDVEKFIGTIHYDYEGVYSDYEKAVQAAQAAADEYGVENIYFHTVEIATRNDREVYDRDDYEDFIEGRETIRHNWYTLTIVDTGKREHVNLNNPVRLDFEE